MSSEFEKIEILRHIFGEPPAHVSVGIGDDAAVLSCTHAGSQPGELVWTIDTQADGIHFRRDLLSFYDIGWRSLMAAASDLAAMGAVPLGVLSALELPAELTDEDLGALGCGQNAAAKALGTAVIGGNISRATAFAITTSVLGRAHNPPLRNSALAGDWIVSCGQLGLAAAGLRLLLRFGPTSCEDTSCAPAVNAWRRPVALLTGGVKAAAIAHAQIDVSDGLGQDLGHVARASGVRVNLQAAKLVSPSLATAAERLGVDSLGLACGGGEDYAVVAAVPPGVVPEGFSHIGECTNGEGVWVVGTNSDLRIDRCGHDHFADGVE